MVKRLWGNIEERIKDQIYNRGLSATHIKTIERYCKEQASNGRSKNTVSSTLYYLETLSKFLKDKPFKKATKKDLQKFLQQYEGQKEHRYYRKKTRQFYKWLNEGELPKLVAWIDPRRKMNERKEVQIFNDDMKIKMLKCLDNQRDRTILMLLLDSGARPQEVYTAKIGSIQFDEYGAIFKIKGKTGERAVRLIDSVPDLCIHINTHPNNDNTEAPLFYSLAKNRAGQPIGWNVIREIFRKIQKKLGIKNLRPYACRHTKLTELGRNKILTAYELKAFAGHSSIRTSDIYVHTKDEDANRSILEHIGLLDKSEAEALKQSITRPRKCPRCKMENSALAKFCKFCYMTLDIRASSEVMEMAEFLGKDKTARESLVDSYIENPDKIPEMILKAVECVLAKKEKAK